MARFGLRDRCPDSRSGARSNVAGRSELREQIAVAVMSHGYAGLKHRCAVALCPIDAPLDRRDLLGMRIDILRADHARPCSVDLTSVRVGLRQGEVAPGVLRFQA